MKRIVFVAIIILALFAQGCSSFTDKKQSYPVSQYPMELRRGCWQYAIKGNQETVPEGERAVLEFKKGDFSGRDIGANAGLVWIYLEKPNGEYHDSDGRTYDGTILGSYEIKDNVISITSLYSSTQISIYEMDDAGMTMRQYTDASTGDWGMLRISSIEKQ